MLLLLSVLIVGSMTPAISMIVPNWQTVVHADDNGTSGTCYWDITNGVLTIQPTNGESGTLGVITTTSEWDTVANRTTITSVEIKPGVIANTNSSNMFYGLENCTEINGLKNLNTSSVTNMSYMFASCNALQSLDLDDFKTNSVTTMVYMFYLSRGLEQLDLSSFDTSRVTLMSYMFYNCRGLKQLNLSSFNTSIVTSMYQMFNNCDQLQELDLSNFDMSQVGSTLETYMFHNCTSMWKLTLGNKFSLTTWMALSNPVEDTLFDSFYEVNSTKWRLVGSGDAHHPQGAELTAAEIITQHNGQGTTDTYVWQGTRIPDGQTNVDYTIDPSYTITIPEGITISNSNGKGSGDVELGAYPKLPYNERLITIRVTSVAWKLTNDHDTTGVAYLFGTNEGDNDLSTGTPFTFEANGEKATPTVQTVYATLPSGSEFKYAETYTDTVNYTISTGEPVA
ncbi:MAG: DUF285 domain-containing protein [Lactobacillaceae bacterium]|jgi:surface protein|nr:DUF285 domain-containing protein [Lactobacillaceae bacterium]